MDSKSAAMHAFVRSSAPTFTSMLSEFRNAVISSSNSGGVATKIWVELPFLPGWLAERDAFLESGFS